ncbi:HAMP domain-containing sensor histidine kinase [Pseudarthrobacter sp. SSS035]|uniref:sensor histidine kinase n=1 Tax=Pseudarthrobacter sp. SSS035 TaxID=2931399 RepID=UPI0020109734|nr:HAMP domain-containing sensor histidine kinase [Pseudarthrobacter sp. SSS035]
MLAEADTQPSLSRLRRIRDSEPDSWVRVALERAIAKWEHANGGLDVGEAWISVPSEELEDAKAEAIQSVTQVILHEIRPLVSDIRSAVKLSLGASFEDSLAFKRIERLKSFLTTIHRLNEAAAAPRYIEFDLVSLVLEEIHAGGFTKKQAVASRADPVSTKGDPGLLRLALQNAIRNAVEASEESQNQVVINCGVNDTHAWVAVLDEGVGLPEATERVWEPGVSKKSRDLHFGWGLTIAQRAIHSLGGTIRLTPRKRGGTSCEIRWPLPAGEEGTYEDSAD